MNVLAFDTAMGALSAAILSDGQIVSARHELLSRGHAEKLMPMIAEVCDEAGLEVVDCQRIGVTIGPGTFTGQRVGLAAARAMRLGTELGLVGITTLKAIAAGVDDADTTDVIVSVLDARRGEVYMQTFAGTLAALGPPNVLPPQDAVDQLSAVSHPLVLVGTGAKLIEPALTAAGMKYKMSEAAEQPDARLVARLAALREQGTSHIPSPLYLRAPDAKLPRSK